MSYIGSTPTTQSFIAGTDYFNGNGSTTAFTLSRPVVSVNDIQAVVNNVVQVPNDAYNVSGSTITFTSAPSSGTGNVYVRYMSTTTQSITPSQNTVSYATWNSDLQNQTFGFKNRIINGAMVIDQRNAGSSINPASGIPTFAVDRFNCYQELTSKLTFQQNAGSVTPPAGFTNYLGATSSSAYSVTAGQIFGIYQSIEGYNFADLGFGTANAKTITISFRVYSSLTGTFGGALKNNGGSRSYPFAYTISAANTWTTISVTIPGDTSGTWLTTNGIGATLSWGLGVGSTYSGTAGAWAATNYFSATGAVSVVGTNGATFYITGVQLEVGSTATSFDYRPYGTELALCQRYCFVMSNTDSAANRYALGFANSSTKGYVNTPHPVPMRTKPSLTTTGASTFQLSDASAGTVLTAISIQSVTSDVNKTSFDCTTASGLTAYRPYYLEPYVGASAITLSAEL